MPGPQTSSPTARALGWSTGLPLAAVTATLAIALLEPRLDVRHAEVADAVVRGLATPGAEPWLTLSWSGRDARAEGEAPGENERAAARRALAELPDLRILDDRIGIVTRAAPFTWRATRMDSATFATEGNRPAEIGRTAFATRLVSTLPPGGARLLDDTRAARGSAPGFADWATYALGLVAHLAPGGRAVLTGDALTLHGSLGTPDAAAELRAALATPPPGLTLTEAALEPPRVEPYLWSVTRGAEGLRLDGFVPSEAARAQLVVALREAAEGAPVEDRAALARGLSARVDAAAFARLVGGVLGLLAEGRIGLEGERLSVSGVAVDEPAVPEIARRLEVELPSAGLRRGTLAVGTRPIAPYRVAIRREADRVILAGHLPDPAVRDALLDAVRPRFFGERIVDRIRFAGQAPDGLAAALTTGLDALALLATGEVVAEDRTLTLVGESLYRGPARRLRTAALPLPPGWRQAVTVRGPEEPDALAPATCRDRLRRASAGAPLRFAPGSADLEAAAYPLLDAVASLARDCPGLRVEVAGRPDPAASTPVPKAEAAEAERKTAPPETAAAGTEPPWSPAPTTVASKGVPPKGMASRGPASKEAKPAVAAPRGETEQDARARAEAQAADLPQRRALAVVDYLLKAGVPSERAIAVPVPADAGDEAAQVVFVLRS